DGQQESSSVSSQFVTSMLNPKLDVGMESIFETTSRIDVQTPTSVAPLPITTPTMALRSSKQNFSEVMQTNQFADQLREEAQRDNDEFLRTIDENIKKIIKEQVKEQVKAQVSKILPRIEQAMDEQLEAEKMEGNKSIQRSDEQRNLYKALFDAYESDKIIIDTYGKTVTLKRRRDDDEGKDEEPFAGPDQGSKRRREGKEPESTSAPSETATKRVGRSTTGSRSRQASASESAFAEEPVQTTSQMEDPSHPEFDTDQLDWVNPKGQQYPHNLLQPLPLIPDSRGRRVIPFAHFINNDLEYLRGGKLTNLTVKEHFAFNVSLRMFTRSIVIQRRVEDLQLCVKSYQKRLNLTKPDTYRSDLKRKEAYTAYSNPRGFIYHNKDKKNRLMRIDELHKFSDGTLTGVRTTLDDRLKGIQMRTGIDLPRSLPSQLGKLGLSSRLKISFKIIKDSSCSKEGQDAFENADSSLRVELIPSKIKYANKVILNFHKEFSVFSSFTRKGNDGLLQDQVFKNKEEVVIKVT
nr:hypothetical protein [Tanacetum cinerariifolium]